MICISRINYFVFHNILYSFLILNGNDIISSFYGKCIFIFLTTMISLRFYFYQDKFKIVSRVIAYHKFYFFFSILLLSFVFFGFSLLNNIYQNKFSLVKISILTLAIFYWSYVLLVSTLTLIYQHKYKIKELFLEEVKYPHNFKRSQHDIRITQLLIFGIILLIAGVFSIVWYPGVISPDTLHVYYSAKNFSNPITRTDIHSFALVLFEKIVFDIYDNHYFLLLIFLVLFAWAWSSFMTFLYQKGLKRFIIVTISVLYLLLIPGNLYMLMTTWKDIPFSISIIWVCHMLTRYCYNKKEFFKKKNIFILILSLVLTALLRSNGLSILLALLVWSFYEACKWKKFKMLSIVGTSFLLVLIIKIPIYDVLLVRSRMPIFFAALPLINGIEENLKNENDVPIYVLNIVNKYRNKSSDFSFKQAIDTYFLCLIKHPLTTLMDRLKSTYNLYSFFGNSKYPVSRNLYVKPTSKPEWGGDYIFSYNSTFSFLRNRLINFAKEYYSFLFGNVFDTITRNGFNIVLWIIVSWVIILSKKQGIVIILPAIANTVALMLACCFSDYRYSYPMGLMTVMYTLSTITFIGSSSFYE